MAKKTVKRSAAKKGTGPKGKPTQKKKQTKKTAAAKGAKKVSGKKTISERERQERSANLIANSGKKILKPRKGRPSRPLSEKQTSGLLDAVVEGMQEKKAKNISILNLTGIESRVCDYFVICDADSKTHVEAIAGSVEEVVEKVAGEKPFHSEGWQNAEWILIDYINIVAHVFLREAREHYNIEALWGDAEMTIIN